MAEDRRKKEFEGRQQNFGLDDKINSAVVICSVPYATDDNASEESKAKALNLVKDCPLSSAVFNGCPINNLFKYRYINRKTPFS